MTRTRREVEQEPDRIDVRRSWLVLGATALAIVLLCVTAWLVFRVFTGERMRPPADPPARAAAPVGAPPAGPPRVRGEPFRANRVHLTAPDTVEGGAPPDPGGAPRYAWVDSAAGLVRVPVEVAMEAVAAAGAEAAAPDSTAGGPP